MQPAFGLVRSQPGPRRPGLVARGVRFLVRKAYGTKRRTSIPFLLCLRTGITSLGTTPREHKLMEGAKVAGWRLKEFDEEHAVVHRATQGAKNAWLGLKQVVVIAIVL